MNWTVLFRSSRDPASFLSSEVGCTHMSLLKELRLGHCCKIWAVVSVARLQKRQSGVFSALNFECMCCLSLLCPVLRRKMVTCSGRVSRWYWSCLLEFGCTLFQRCLIVLLVIVFISGRSRSFSKKNPNYMLYKCTKACGQCHGK